MMSVERVIIARKILKAAGALAAAGILVLLVLQILLGSPVDTGRILTWVQIGLLAIFVVAFALRLIIRRRPSRGASTTDPINDLYLGRTSTPPPPQVTVEYSAYPERDT